MSPTAWSPAIVGGNGPRREPIEASDPVDHAAPIWKRWLRRRSGPTGEPELVPCITNAVLVLVHDEFFAGCFARDTFASCTRLRRSLPRIEGLTSPPTGAITDAHVTYAIIALAAMNRLSIGFEMAARAIDAASLERSHDPLVDYLVGLRWDAVSRLDRWLSIYLGVPETAYSRSVGRWWLISAIARARRPGCQADHVLVLEGPQGSAKSSAIGILGGDFTLSKLPSLRDYDRAAHALAGRWIVEIGELDAFRGAASSQIKDFLSLREDRYREPYARHPVSRGRSCVFVGTTNDAQYLRDPTGARRFWPVRVGDVDRAGLARDRDMILAEAAAAFDAGQPFADLDRPSASRWWPDREMLDGLAEEQSERGETDDWTGPVGAWLDMDSGGRKRDGVTTGDALEAAIGLDRGRWGRDEQTRVGTILRGLGWVTKRQIERGARVRRYYRPTD